ncbi:MAG: 30S ribosomal protein S14 [Nitrospiraceae bacterium]|nr:30S ribosomal protein S14 [Nitrospiraceae bacterium]
MTASSYKKALNQLKNKSAKKIKYLKHNEPKPRKYGIDAHKCSICGRTGAHISAYGLHLCRQCFRENATKLGFQKYS